ncbi:MAG TPA: hypothetical protein VM840_12950 [Actinomycetota bacterium]|nr:hypothetical protein [Actinomycetota bacterium]
MLVAAAAVAIARSDPPAQSPTPAPASTPEPGIVAELDGEVRRVAGLGEGAVDPAVQAAAGLLKQLYELSFLPEPAPGPDGVGPPRPPPEVLATDTARAPFVGSRGAFAAGEAAEVVRGRVGFHGALFGEGDAVQAFLVRVSFVGEGRVLLPQGPRPARFTQAGELLLEPTETGWRLGGFDVALTVEREGDPSPSPQAARWMP